jgi:hypothetical protein
VVATTTHQVAAAFAQDPTTGQAGSGNTFRPPAAVNGIPFRIDKCIKSGRYTDATATACCSLRSFRGASKQDECNAVLKYFNPPTGAAQTSAAPSILAGPTGATGATGAFLFCFCCAGLSFFQVHHIHTQRRHTTHRTYTKNQHISFSSQHPDAQSYLLFRSDNETQVPLAPRVPLAPPARPARRASSTRAATSP